MELDKLYKSLRDLRLDNGLYLASTGPFYQKVWVRDCFYASLSELKSNPDFYRQTYHTLLDYYINMENKYGKFSWLIKEPHPKAGYRYPHPRLTTYTLDEIHEPWGFKQNDCIGEVLYGIYLGESNGISIIRDDKDREIINLMIKMLESIEYWNDPDNGIWEEYEEVHASSVGACLAGLTSIKLLGFIVNQELLNKAHDTLNKLLPRESLTKEVDLALLSLIWPFNIVDPFMAREILNNVETRLLRHHGVIRYESDKYYNIANPENIELGRLYKKDSTYIGNEAEWCFGFAFLCLSYNQLGDTGKAKYYLRQLEKCYIDGNVPELFYSKTNIPGDNNPLSWCVSMAIVSININD